MVGTPDIKFNLDTTTSLPFEVNEFNCVSCVEVLEHLDNLHFIFDELIRISKQYLLFLCLIVGVMHELRSKKER